LLGKQSVVGEWLGKWGIQIVFSWTGTVIAAMVVAFPIMYRTARGAFEQVNPDWVDAARTLGLSEKKIFYSIILPNCWRGVLAGTLLSFARALGEFGATIMLAGNIPGKTQTLATAVYTAVQNGDRARAYEWVGIMVAISFSTIVLLQLIQSQQGQWLKKGGNKK
ncbi:MAG: molybdenum ABC transporter permease, partial [Niameybacter sp.]